MASTGSADGARQPEAGLSSSPISNSSRDSGMASRLQNARRLTFRVLQEITDNFSDKRKIGQGAYGKVYLAKLENGEDIAVKMLYNNKPGIDDVKFQREFENLMRLEHHNIVKLVGYCYETQHEAMEFMGKTIFSEITHKALCFEYMQNGSLQKHISDECDGLDWLRRYKIIKGTSEGLKYLHKGFEEPMYHLDLKPDNILLDKDMVPKLADFGMSKFFGDQQTMTTHSAIGTFGYLPMEFLHGNIVSRKLDIFSLGVIMIKIIAGHGSHSRSVEMSHKEFPDLVHSNWRKRMQKTCSPRPLEAYCEQVSVCTELALRCMENDRHKRPDIADIIRQLNVTEADIQKALSWSSSSHSAVQGDLLEVQTFTRSEAIPGDQTCAEFPVLVQVTAPPWPVGEHIPRTGVDIVAVLDIDKMVLDEPKRNLLKQAMTMVIDKLGPSDRFSVVSFEAHLSFNDKTPRILELTSMSNQGRYFARQMVNKLSWSHGTSMVAGLEMGAEILKGREVEEGESRVGCIMLVSEGSEKDVVTRHTFFSSEFPVHTFGLHNIVNFTPFKSIMTYTSTLQDDVSETWVMKYIADKTSGVYSYVEDDTNSIMEAFELFITGITSVAVTCLKVSLAAQEGVAISSIESGGHANKVSFDKTSGEVSINDIYAGERKNVIVYLTVEKGKNKLLTVGGRYRGFNSCKVLGDMDVFVLRPSSPRNLAIHPEVATELARIRLEKALSAMVEVKYHQYRSPEEQSQMQAEWQELWNRIRYSDEGRGAREEILSELVKDVAEIEGAVVGLYGHNPKDVPYLMSWLSCHKWQRATTKGSRSNSGAFSLAQHHI